MSTPSPLIAACQANDVDTMIEASADWDIEMVPLSTRPFSVEMKTIYHPELAVSEGKKAEASSSV